MNEQPSRPDTPPGAPAEAGPPGAQHFPPGGHVPPWMWRRGFARRRRARMLLPLIAGACFLASRCARRRRPEVGVFAGVMFHPVTRVDVSLFGGRRRRRRGLARLLGRSRR